jgi:hypothetical protein
MSDRTTRKMNPDPSYLLPKLPQTFLSDGKEFPRVTAFALAQFLHERCNAALAGMCFPRRLWSAIIRAAADATFDTCRRGPTLA